MARPGWNSSLPENIPSELLTPAICVDIERLRELSATAAKYVTAAQKTWRADAGAHGRAAVASIQLAEGASGLAVNTVSQAERFLKLPFTDILIQQPVVGQAAIEQLVSLCRSRPVIATCDHFAQAEAVSTACMEGKTECRILLEINVGLDRAGVRPGPDAVEMMQGMCRLPAVSLAGVTACESESVDTARLQGTGRLLRSVCREMQRLEPSATIVSLGVNRAAGAWCDKVDVTELRTLDPFAGTEKEAAAPLRLLARVISRPSLDRAVVDFGWTHFTASDEPQIVSTFAGRRLGGVHIQSMERNRTTLALGGSGRDLVIGDVVEIAGCDLPAALKRFDPVYVIRNEQVAGIW